MNFSFLTVFLKNRNNSSKIKRSKVTDYAALNESLDFVTVHNLMEDINMIDSCQAHLPVQYVYASNIEVIRQK